MLKRTEIRNDTISLLTGATDAGSHVFPSRTTPLSNGDIPAVLVYTERNLAEAIEPEHEPVNLNFKNDLDLVVEVHATSDTDDNLDDALDAIVDQVEQALLGSETWVRRFSQISSVDTDVTYDAQSDKRRGTARMTLSLSYLTTFNFS